jgi:hypothetical protein
MPAGAARITEPRKTLRNRPASSTKSTLEEPKLEEPKLEEPKPEEPKSWEE